MIEDTTDPLLPAAAHVRPHGTFPFGDDKLRALVIAGEIPGVRLGKGKRPRVLVRRSAIDRYLAENTIGAQSRNGTRGDAA